MNVRLEARGLRRTIASKAGASDLVRDVSFAARDGEFVAIVGPSGCGKSSLLYLLGLLDTPCAGDVLIEGRSTRLFSDAQRTQARLEQIGFVFQFHFLLPELSTFENVALPMRRLGQLASAAIEARTWDLLCSLGLDQCGHRRPDKLSGGQRQRAAIARALANDPALLLCDEPTGNLDSANSESVADILQRAAHTHGRTVLCVTHDERLAARADRVIRMRDASVLSDSRRETATLSYEPR